MQSSDKSSEVEGLLKSIRRGDHTAFQELHSLLAEPLTRFAWQIVREQDMAGDIVQSAFVKVFENHRRIRKKLRAYCFSVVGNLARDHLRRQGVFNKWQSGQSTDQVSEDTAEQTVLAKEAWAALLELPVTEREPLVLRFDQDLSVSEVAVALGCPKGTAATRIRRGLERLRESLSGNSRFSALPAGAMPGLLTSHPPEVPSIAIPSWTNLEATLMATTTTKLTLTGGALALILLLLIGGVTAVVIASGDESPDGNTTAAQTLIPEIDNSPVEIADSPSNTMSPKATNDVETKGNQPTTDTELDSQPAEPEPEPGPEEIWADFDRLGGAEAWRIAKGSAAVEGRLLDQYGQPITDGRVTVRDWSFKRDGRRMHVPSYSVPVNPDGSFAFVVPLAAQNGSTAGFEIEYTRTGSTDHARMVSYQASISDKPHVWQDVEVQLYVGSAGMELQVLSESGQAAKSVKVTLTRQASNEGDSFAELDSKLGTDDSETDLVDHLDTPVQRIAYTDWRGMVNFEGLPPGRYTASAQRPLLPPTTEPAPADPTIAVVLEDGDIDRSGRTITIPDAIEIVFNIKQGEVIDTGLKVFMIFTAEDGGTVRFDSYGKSYPGRHEHRVSADGLIVLRLNANALRNSLGTDHARVKIWGAKKGYHVMQDSELLELTGGLRHDFGEVFKE